MKTHLCLYHLEAQGNKYKDLYEFIPQRLEIIPFGSD